MRRVSSRKDCGTHAVPHMMADVGLLGILVLRLSTRKHARIVQWNATCATRHSNHSLKKQYLLYIYILILSFPVGKWLERNYKLKTSHEPLGSAHQLISMSPGISESSIVRVAGMYTLKANLDLIKEPVFNTVHPCCVLVKLAHESPITTRSGRG